MTSLQSFCIYCNKSDQSIPLLPFQFKGEQYWICPQHLPILIHHPEQLAGKLPGLGQISPVGENA